MANNKAPYAHAEWMKRKKQGRPKQIWLNDKWQKVKPKA